MASAYSSRPAAYHAPAPVPSAPPGTFSPGTKVQVGNHRVVIEKYLSEGGFAHVYTVRVPRSGDKHDIAVLKRVAVPDKEALANMRTEVETMKKLKGHKYIVTYIDSHASQLKGSGYEVFLLMEYCQGGGLIDFMNTRLQHRLTEPEILKIFSDVSEGVACMHYLKPPLLHRDLKVENVLISTSGSSRLYKLCDFGSTAPPRPAATTATEGRLIEDDVQRHTTLQYRSPEMVDVWRKLPIDEKSDIWALGVLLYKLCYYTTPFEDQGQMAILNASFKYPPYPSFSDRIKRLIGSMLRESPKARPNIYQVVAEVCSMRNTPIPIHDIYANRSQSEARKNQQLPSPDAVSTPPIVGLQKSAPVQQVQEIPDIVPMRRGRPTGPAQTSSSTKPSPSPGRAITSGDPFAALDSSSAPVRAAAADELASRFPSLDEFSLLHDKGNKFEFSPTSPPASKQDSLNKRVTQALADEVFAKPVPPPKDTPTVTKAQTIPTVATTSKPTTKEEPRARDVISQSTASRSRMVSTGVGASPPPSPKVKPKKYPDVNQRPVWRVPSDSRPHSRTMSQPRTDENPRKSAPTLHPEHTLPTRPSMVEAQRSKSTLSVQKSPASSRPSLEGSRPSTLDINETISRSKSANARPRPTSLHVESSLDYLRDREGRPSMGDTNRPRLTPDPEANEDKNIDSNVDFLRAMEGDESTRRKEKRSSSGSRHSKRSSIPSISLSHTKNKLAGKFGDAFRRFETSQPSSSDIPRTPSPSLDHPTVLTPIAGSEATDGRSDDGSALDETQELAPEVRRELERHRLEQEEKRVAEAAAEYQRRVASGQASQGLARASTIQNRVKNLLDESKKEVAPARTAEGYGRFTDSGAAEERASRKPAVSPNPSAPYQPKPRPFPTSTTAAPPSSNSAPPAVSTLNTAPQRTGPRPSAPPKPKALQTGGSVAASSPSLKQSPVKPASLAGRPVMAGQVPPGESAEDWEANFSKRYPSLSGIEMVETEIPAVRTGERR